VDSGAEGDEEFTGQPGAAPAQKVARRGRARIVTEHGQRDEQAEEQQQPSGAVDDIAAAARRRRTF
jgi:hypothetical protein